MKELTNRPYKGHQYFTWCRRVNDGSVTWTLDRYLLGKHWAGQVTVTKAELCYGGRSSAALQLRKLRCSMHQAIEASLKGNPTC